MAREERHAVSTFPPVTFSSYLLVLEALQSALYENRAIKRPTDRSTDGPAFVTPACPRTPRAPSRVLGSPVLVVSLLQALVDIVVVDFFLIFFFLNLFVAPNAQCATSASDVHGCLFPFSLLLSSRGCIVPLVCVCVFFLLLYSVPWRKTEPLVGSLLAYLRRGAKETGPVKNTIRASLSRLFLVLFHVPRSTQQLFLPLPSWT